MGRALKILAYAVILFLTYLVITAALKSFSTDKNEVASAEVVNTSEESDTFDDDYFEDGREEENETDNFFGVEDNVDNIDYDEIDKTLENTKTKAKKVSSPINTDYTTLPNSSVPKDRYIDSSGDFLVIAGSYIINTNAEDMVLKLKRMGYEYAEIVIFDMSQYHTVVAKRSTSYDKALSTVNGLKSKGIDSYVHTKKE